MRRDDLVDKVVGCVDQPRNQVEQTVRCVFDCITDALASGEKVQLTGFGTFEVRQRAARQGVKPGTSEKIYIPASKAAAFKAGKALKDAVNRPGL